VPVGQRREVEDLEVDRHEGRGQRRLPREVAERQLPLSELGVLQEPPPRGPLARGDGHVALGQAVHECGEVESSVALNLDVEVQPVDLHVREGPRPAEQAGQLEVDQEAAEPDEGLAGRILQPEALHLEAEQERIDAHVADCHLASELLLRIPRQVTLEQGGRQREARQRV
jgi:hypothetical protein